MRNCNFESEEEICESNQIHIVEGFGMLVTFIINITVLMTLFFISFFMQWLVKVTEKLRKLKRKRLLLTK